MPDWRAIFRAQCVYEQEGAVAGLAGKTREDCPYDRTVNADGWNFWVYGCDIARGEVEVIKKGYVEFIDLQRGNVVETLTVEEAIKSARWCPRWARPGDNSKGDRT